MSSKHHNRIALVGALASILKNLPPDLSGVTVAPKIEEIHPKAVKAFDPNSFSEKRLRDKQRKLKFKSRR